MLWQAFGRWGALGGAFSTPTVTTGEGALAYRTSTTALGTSNPSAVTFDLEAQDDASWHDTGSNTSRLTVPGGVSLVRLVGNYSWDSTSNLPMGLYKNGASFAGRGKTVSSSGSNEQGNVKSGPISVSASDYFELMRETATNPAFHLTNAPNWLGVEALPASLSYCRVSLSGNQAGTVGSFARIAFDQADVDVGGWFNGGVVSVPSGVSWVRITSNARSSSFTGTLGIAHRIEGAQFRGMGRHDVDFAGVKYASIASAIVAVNPGDEIDTYAIFEAAGDIVAGDETWMTVEAVEPTIKRVLCYKNANQNVGGSAFGVLTFQEEVYDTDAAHDLTNSSRITIPSGVTRARFSFNFISSNENRVLARVIKNGSTTLEPGMPGDSCAKGFAGDTTSVGNGLGMWVAVTPGDYFELEVFSGTTTHPFATDNAMWFAAEFV